MTTKSKTSKSNSSKSVKKSVPSYSEGIIVIEKDSKWRTNECYFFKSESELRKQVTNGEFTLDPSMKFFRVGSSLNVELTIEQVPVYETKTKLASVG